MSRCTPSRETSGPPRAPSRPATLSISSMKMMPSSPARRSASRLTASMSMSFAASSCAKIRRASATVTRFLILALRAGCRRASRRCRRRCVHLVHADHRPIGMLGVSSTSISISARRRSRARSRARVCRECAAPSRAAARRRPAAAAAAALKLLPKIEPSVCREADCRPARCGARVSRMQHVDDALDGLAARPRRALPRAVRRSTVRIAASTRSRTIDSTSRPT